MNCPKCGKYMYFIRYQSTDGAVFRCSFCRRIYTERQLEENPTCAACGDIMSTEADESLCDECLDKAVRQETAYP